LIKIAILAIFFLLFLVLFMNMFTELTKKDKIKVVIITIALTIVAFIYESSLSSKTHYNRDLIVNFRQGKTLNCSQTDVNSSYFNFVSGTLSFVGKKEENKNLLFEISECK